MLHAHPPVATGYAVANKALDEYTMIESVIAIGSVPVTPYGTPSTDEVPEAIKPYLQEHDVMLLQNHGALTVGADLITAYYRMETLELFAKISSMPICWAAHRRSPERTSTGFAVCVRSTA